MKGLYKLSAVTLVVVLLAFLKGDALIKQQRCSRASTLVFGKMGMPDHMTEEEAHEDSDEKVTVRFKLGEGKKDVIVEANMGANLMLIGDECGIKMPRACRTGLCGTCTTVVKDPMAVATQSNPREGWATIRACSTKCYPPPDLDEMIVDMSYMGNRANGGGNGRSSDSSKVEISSGETSNPMARFSGDWEREFKPSWEINKGELRPGQKLSRDQSVCSACSGTGRCSCYNCSGSGITSSCVWIENNPMLSLRRSTNHNVFKL